MMQDYSMGSKRTPGVLMRVKFIYVMLFVSLAIFTVISTEDRVNRTKTKLKMAYISSPGQASFHLVPLHGV